MKSVQGHCLVCNQPPDPPGHPHHIFYRPPATDDGPPGPHLAERLERILEIQIEATTCHAHDLCQRCHCQVAEIEGYYRVIGEFKQLYHETAHLYKQEAKRKEGIDTLIDTGLLELEKLLGIDHNDPSVQTLLKSDSYRHERELDDCDSEPNKEQNITENCVVGSSCETGSDEASVARSEEEFDAETTPNVGAKSNSEVCNIFVTETKPCESTSVSIVNVPVDKNISNITDRGNNPVEETQKVCENHSPEKVIVTDISAAVNGLETQQGKLAEDITGEESEPGANSNYPITDIKLEVEEFCDCKSELNESLLDIDLKPSPGNDSKYEGFPFPLIDEKLIKKEKPEVEVAEHDDLETNGEDRPMGKSESETPREVETKAASDRGLAPDTVGVSGQAVEAAGVDLAQCAVERAQCDVDLAQCGADLLLPPGDAIENMETEAAVSRPSRKRRHNQVEASSPQLSLRRRPVRQVSAKPNRWKGRPEAQEYTQIDSPVKPCIADNGPTFHNSDSGDKPPLVSVRAISTASLSAYSCSTCAAGFKARHDFYRHIRSCGKVNQAASKPALGKDDSVAKVVKPVVNAEKTLDNSNHGCAQDSDTKVEKPDDDKTVLQNSSVQPPQGAKPETDCSEKVDSKDGLESVANDSLESKQSSHIKADNKEESADNDKDSSIGAEQVTEVPAAAVAAENMNGEVGVDAAANHTPIDTSEPATKVAKVETPDEGTKSEVVVSQPQNSTENQKPVDGNTTETKMPSSIPPHGIASGVGQNTELNHQISSSSYVGVVEPPTTLATSSQQIPQVKENCLSRLLESDDDNRKPQASNGDPQKVSASQNQMQPALASMAMSTDSLGLPGSVSKGNALSAMPQGAMPQNPMQQGPLSHGSLHQGPMPQGQRPQGHMPPGAMHQGQMQHGQIPPGPASQGYGSASPAVAPQDPQMVNHMQGFPPYHQPGMPGPGPHAGAGIPQRFPQRTAPPPYGQQPGTSPFGPRYPQQGMMPGGKPRGPMAVSAGMMPQQHGMMGAEGQQPNMHNMDGYSMQAQQAYMQQQQQQPNMLQQQMPPQTPVPQQSPLQQMSQMQQQQQQQNMQQYNQYPATHMPHQAKQSHAQQLQQQQHMQQHMQNNPQSHQQQQMAQQQQQTQAPPPHQQHPHMQHQTNPPQHPHMQQHGSQQNQTTKQQHPTHPQHHNVPQQHVSPQHPTTKQNQTSKQQNPSKQKQAAPQNQINQPHLNSKQQQQQTPHQNMPHQQLQQQHQPGMHPHQQIQTPLHSPHQNPQLHSPHQNPQQQQQKHPQHPHQQQAQHPQAQHPQHPQAQHPQHPQAQHPQHPQAQHPQAPHPQAQHPQHPQAQHPQAQHPQAQHPQAQHPQAPHPQAPHPQAQHPQAQHPQAPHPQAQHPQSQHPQAQAPHPQAQHPQHPQAQHPQAQHPQAQHPQAQHPQAPHPPAQHPPAQHPQAQHPQNQQTQHPQAQHPQAQHPHGTSPKQQQQPSQRPSMPPQQSQHNNIAHPYNPQTPHMQPQQAQQQQAQQQAQGSYLHPGRQQAGFPPQSLTPNPQQQMSPDVNRHLSQTPQPQHAQQQHGQPHGQQQQQSHGQQQPPHGQQQPHGQPAMTPQHLMNHHGMSQHGMTNRQDMPNMQGMSNHQGMPGMPNMPGIQSQAMLNQQPLAASSVSGQHRSPGQQAAASLSLTASPTGTASPNTQPPHGNQVANGPHFPYLDPAFSPPPPGQLPSKSPQPASMYMHHRGQGFGAASPPPGYPQAMGRGTGHHPGMRMAGPQQQRHPQHPAMQGGTNPAMGGMQGQGQGHGQQNSVGMNYQQHGGTPPNGQGMQAGHHGTPPNGQGMQAGHHGGMQQHNMQHQNMQQQNMQQNMQHPNLQHNMQHPNMQHQNMQNMQHQSMSQHQNMTQHLMSQQNMQHPNMQHQNMQHQNMSQQQLMQQQNMQQNLHSAMPGLPPVVDPPTGSLPMPHQQGFPQTAAGGPQQVAPLVGPHQGAPGSAASSHQMAAAGGDFKPPPQEGSFSCASALVNLAKTHSDPGKPLKCLQCDASFLSADMLLEHSRVHGCEPGEVSMDDADRTSSNATPASSSKDMSPQPSPSPQPKKRKAREPKSWRCSKCNITCENAEDWAEHRRSHMGEKAYPCPTCGVSFAAKWYLTRHQRTHSGEKPHKCEVCGKAFGRPDHLRKHSTIHATKPTTTDSTTTNTTTNSTTDSSVST